MINFEMRYVIIKLCAFKKGKKFEKFQHKHCCLYRLGKSNTSVYNNNVIRDIQYNCAYTNLSDS